ncbi:Zf-FLZ domain [Dillenia turbinata]|uniref:Zf-FLZ domain n=1 Tax=Dillenia turbinata TaxID=194707 RepID=A0AAN8VM05_9MAGN
MLRNRSRAVTSKQAIMTEQNSLIESPTRPISFFFGSSPKNFIKNNFPEAETLMSPKSLILDTRAFSVLENPFCDSKNISKSPKTFSENKRSWEDQLESKGIALALVDVLNDGKNDNNVAKQGSKTVLFGSKLKLQIPSLKSPTDFGIKTPRSQVGFFQEFGGGCVNCETPTKRRVSASELELSEDYTCVILHGPNPRTTHIYDDCIVENCCDFDGFSKSVRNEACAENLLAFCYACKKSLGQEKDIYMYRGEKAFCSRECLCQEMLFHGLERTHDA